MPQDTSNRFNHGLKRFISQAVPFKSAATIIDDVRNLNPKFQDFYKAGSLKAELLNQHSVFIPDTKKAQNEALGTFYADKTYTEMMYATLDLDKGRRLRDYRVMASSSEVSNALDEICDEFLNEDDQGNLIKLHTRDTFDKTDEAEKILQSEFKNFINLFELAEKGWEYIRKLLVDGELYFENIVHKDYIDRGILGLINIPTHLIDPIYDNRQNLLIKAFLVRKLDEQGEDPGRNEGYQQMKDADFIPLEANQVTYIHSGTWNEDTTFRVPFINNARRPYRQLTLIEDAVIIYRLVRAPERLVFNVDVGNMSTPKSEQYLRRLMQNYWSKKSFNLDENKRVDSFNPQSILDAYWFPKREGSQGTTVTNLPGGANLGEIDDLLYYVRKLYEALKVPVNRIDKESVFSSDANILREELNFANFIVRLQQNFARGLKSAFITHLKLRKIWSQLELRENIFDLVFTPPRNYYELRKQQMLDLKFNNFSNMAGNELISTSYAQKKYLGWSDEEIKANREWLRRDAKLQKELESIATGGSYGGDGMGGAEMGGNAGNADAFEDVPPDFGPGDPSGTDASNEPAETEEQPPEPETNEQI
jgi:hypothetical protein